LLDDYFFTLQVLGIVTCLWTTQEIYMGHVAFLATKELKFVHLLYWHKALRLLDGLVVESYWL
jgi:hypothetical protein